MRLFDFYTSLLRWASLPVLLRDFFDERTGRDHRVSFATKLHLVRTMRANTSRIVTASSFVEHLVMASAILSVPASVDGCLIECGCYKGGSTANLSLAAGLCGRRLLVFDSFDGLPEPSGRDRAHVLPHERQIHTYQRGAYRGPLDEVKTNISRFGRLDACEFHPGYFQETLAGFDRPCVFAFLDVDLLDSLEICVQAIWPRLEPGCCLFVHEAAHREVAALFFDGAWWRRHLGEPAPGLVGAGTGLGLLPASGSFRSALGYARKGESGFRTMQG